jgi:hypothetical protein
MFITNADTQYSGCGSGSELIFVGWIRIKRWKNDPQKFKKAKKFMF